MIRDLRRTWTEPISTDVCIVGSGAAGIALATELIDSGMRVLLLETGGEKFDADADALSDGESIGVPLQGGIRNGRFRALGGATWRWAGQCVHFDSPDFETRDWVPHSGWPFTLDTLDRAYRRAERFFGLTGHEIYDEDIWTRFGIADPGFDPRRLRPRFTVFSPHLEIGFAKRRLLKRARNVDVALYGHALRFHLSENGSSVSALDIAVPGHPELKVHSRVYVMANGGIEAPRLLLLSNAEDERGIGNAHDNVGRYYQDHPNAISATIERADESRLHELFSILYRGRKRYFPKVRISPEFQRDERILNAVVNLRFEFDAKALDDLRVIVAALRRRKLPDRTLGRAVNIAREFKDTVSIFHRRYVLGRSPKLKPRELLLQVHLEQAPSRESRILLSDSLDRHGQRRALIDWRLGELEHRTFARVTDAVRGEFQRLKLGEVIPLPWTADVDSDWRSRVRDSYHYSGATRMSIDPVDGVVDRDLQVHGVENLFVCSGSVFPTSGYANPTLTIVALAMRLADTLTSRFG